MDNYIDELALLRAFIDYKQLSYTEVQEKGLVPLLNKQDRRNLFKNCIEKFKKWGVIEAIAESDPPAWAVIPDKAVAEYNQLVKEIEQRQVIEKYSFQHLQEEVSDHAKKMRRIKLFRALAIIGFVLGTFHFLTGLSLIELIKYLRHVYHLLTGTAH